jgi:hypothetical protein
MSKDLRILSRLVLALIVIVIGNYVIVAQKAVTGEWTGNVKAYDEKSKSKRNWDDKSEVKTENPNKIHLSFSRKSERGGQNQMGSSFEYSDLKGLSREQALSGGAVSFSLVREAGTIDCEGSFSGGKGSGTFVFTPSASFVSAMKTRGFDFEKPSSKGDNDPEERLFAAATINVTTALADDLLSANFGKLDVDDLFKAAIFKVDSRFMREMKDSGFPNLGMEELVKARIFKIDAEFLRDLAQNGFTNEPFESVVKMRIFKITPEFITGVRNEGFRDVSIEQLVKMKIFNIDAEFIRQARAEGVPMDIEKLVQKRIGVWGKE